LIHDSGLDEVDSVEVGNQCFTELARPHQALEGRKNISILKINAIQREDP
jgi:hypothetical protein